MYRKTVITKTLERKHRKCAAMRAAKELKRLAMAPGSVEVGVIIFEGVMFGGGRHIMVIEARDGDNHIYPRIDGVAYKPTTVRGLRALIAKRIA